MSMEATMSTAGCSLGRTFKAASKRQRILHAFLQGHRLTRFDAEELGDLLFSVVNLARWYKVDAESALRETNLKFKRRFQYVEQRAAQQGRSLSDMTLAEMDVLWDEAKGLEDK